MKTCHQRAKRAIERDAAPSDGSRIPFNKDGKNGPNNPNNSEKIIIDWLMTPGNYEKFRGKNNNGVKKKQFAAIIAKMIGMQEFTKSILTRMF